MFLSRSHAAALAILWSVATWSRKRKKFHSQGAKNAKSPFVSRIGGTDAEKLHQPSERHKIASRGALRLRAESPRSWHILAFLAALVSWR